jgi:predicted nucleic acid-binding protein
MTARPWVVDASFAGALLLPDENSVAALELVAQARARRIELITTTLWAHEMANLLVSAVRRHRIPAGRLADAWALVEALPIHAVPGERAPGGLDAAQLAVEAGLTAYDAGYLALALARGAGLASYDTELLKAAKARHVPLWK